MKAIQESNTMETTQKILIEAESQQRNSPWYLLTGLILGVIIGLIYSWLINPIEYQNTDPASLKSSHKDAYRIMIAQVYAISGNLSHASQRLALLGDENPVIILGAQAQRELGYGDDEEARALALLASAIQMAAEAQTPTSDGSESVPTITPTTPAGSIPTQTLPAMTPVP
jgi:hypothetical protein